MATITGDGPFGIEESGMKRCPVPCEPSGRDELLSPMPRPAVSEKSASMVNTAGVRWVTRLQVVASAESSQASVKVKVHAKSRLADLASMDISGV